MALKGVEKVLANINKEIKAIEGRTIAGLTAGGHIVLSEAKKRVPVEFGQLRASGFVRKSPTNPNVVQVGFSASYAVWVHESIEEVLKGMPRPSGKGVYWGPQGQSQFLAVALDVKATEVLDQVTKRIRK